MALYLCHEMGTFHVVGICAKCIWFGNYTFVDYKFTTPRINPGRICRSFSPVATGGEKGYKKLKGKELHLSIRSPYPCFFLSRLCRVLSNAILD